MASVSSFTINNRIKPCLVSRELMEQLEGLCTSARKAFLQREGQPSWNFDVTVVDSVGEEQFDSVNDILTSRLPESTTRVALNLRVQMYGEAGARLGNLKMAFRFSNDYQGNQLSIEATCEEARALAVGLQERALQFLASNYLGPRIFYISSGAKVVLFTVMGFLAGVLIAFVPTFYLTAEGDKKIIAARVLTLGVGVLLALLVYDRVREKFYPNAAFDNQAWTSKEKWRDWANKGFWGFVVFALIAPFAREQIWRAIAGQ